jgi:hypothetical protein
VRGHDSFGERLRKILNRIAKVERAERRCNPQRTLLQHGQLHDMMRKGLGERLSALDPWVLGLACGRYEESTHEC